MKGLLCALMVGCILCLAAGISLAQTESDSFLGRRTARGVEGTGNLICAFGDSIFGFAPGDSVNGYPGDTGCLGVEFDGVSFWVTGRDASHGDIHKLHKFDKWGVHDTSYLQGTSSIWGWRDLVWDGDYLYASDGASVVQIDTATGAVTGVTIPGPQNPNRALAYDPATDHFWVANFGSLIYEFDRSGLVVGSYSNSYAIYGMAWDDVSSDGPWLWVGAQEPGTVIYQYDPINHTYTGLSLDVTTGGSIAGGAGFTTDWDPGLGILFVLHQADNVDLVIGYEITTAAARNVNPLSIDSPGALVEPGVPVTPCATVQNTGDSTETFYTLFLVDSAGTNVYIDSVQVSTLLPDSLFQVCFPDWTPDGQGNVYDLTCITNLGADEVMANDTITGVTMAYAVDSLIESGWAYAPATIDGTIDSLEWSSADVVDISDILGMSSGGVLPNSVILYVMNNDSYLYFAIDYFVDLNDTINDRSFLFLDENNDGLWAPDSSEGCYWVFLSATGPQVWYEPLPVGPVLPSVPGAEFAIGFTDHVALEFSIPLGTEKYEIDAGLGDTMGLHIYAHDHDKDETEGWWLQTMDALNQEDPLYYGDLVLHTLVGIQDRSKERSATVFGLVGAYPSPFSGKTSISFATEARTSITLQVFDVTGRVARELLNGIAEPGHHTVVWDGKDGTGKELPSGVYFYRLHSAGRSSWMKTVLLK